MKLLAVIFTFLAFSVFKLLYLQSSEGQPSIDFPTLENPDIDFIDVSGGCASFTDCLEYIGAVLFNIGAGIIFLVLFLINLFVYVFELFALLLSVTFAGVDGAPWWVNVLLTTPYLGALAFILYKMVRSGKSED